MPEVLPAVQEWVEQLTTEGYATTGPAVPTASVLVTRWAEQGKPRKYRWYWETRYNGAVVAAGIRTTQDDARERGIKELAVAAYVAGLCEADHG